MPFTAAIRASGFTSGIGVNIHAEYTDGKYANTQNVINDLNYLGINLVRDGNLDPTNQGQSNYATLAAAGIRFDLIVNGDQTTAQTMSELQGFAAANPGAIASVEGPNEINNQPITYSGLTGTAAANLLQTNLSTALSQTSLASLPIYSYTGGAPVAGFTAESIHPYPQDGDQPMSWLQTAAATAPSGAPVVITELGYSTLASSWQYGVDDATQAKEIINALLDAAKLGVGKTFLYELLDAYADPTNSLPGNHMGLFNLDNSPKPAALAIHDLMTVLGDTGSTAATFVPTGLNFTISNLPTTGNSLLMEKSNGAFDLAVWNEPTIWNAPTASEVAAATTTVTVSLGATYGTVEVFDVLDSSTPVQVLHNVSEVDLALSDHPYIIEVEPGVVAATSPPPPSTPSSPVSAAATLVSGDGGNNLITVATAGDSVLGGLGDDTISGSNGAEQLYGGAGNDVISLTAGGTIFGGAGNDAITVSGSGGHYVSADLGDDTITSTTAGDSLYGGQGNDSITAVATTTVYGGKGDDHITATSGHDYLSGDVGNDVIVATGTVGGDTFVGGSGADSITVNAAHTAGDLFIINPGDSTASINTEASLDHISGFSTALDHVVLLGHNDLIVGGQTSNEAYVSGSTVYAGEAAAYSAAYAYAFNGSNFAAGTEYIAVHESYSGSTNGTTYLFTHDGSAVAFDGLSGNLASSDVLHAAVAG